MNNATKTYPYKQVVAPQAIIDWQEGGPVSATHGDVYFSKVDGLAESRYVFLQGNRVVQRWAEQPRFVIAELGFGSGLNFFATCQEWARCQERGFLHYLSLEASPFCLADIRQAMRPWPELQPFVESLLAVLPQPTVGFHRITLFEQRVILTLCYGEAADILPQVSAQVDAWYLDGFAPAKNPELWNEGIFKQVARLSAPGATVATFSVARAVRDGLANVGFVVAKQPGFANKREMLVAQKPGEAIGLQSIPRSVAVIGAGLAGANAAFAIASRGAAVTVFEKASNIAKAASGNPGGMIMPHLSAKPEARMRLSLCAMQQAIGRLRQCQQQSAASLWKDCGVLRLVTSQRLRSVYELLAQSSTFADLARAMNAEQASSAAGVLLNNEAIFFPTAGVASPERICEFLLAQSNLPITVATNSEVRDLQMEEGWRVTLANGASSQFDAVVLACGVDLPAAIDLSWMPLEAVRGQIAYLESNTKLQQLKTAVCYDGYILPQHEGFHVVGATFEHDNFEMEVGEAQQNEVLARLCSRLSLTAESLKANGGRVGFRASTQDRYPVVGLLPQRETFVKNYRQVAFSRNYLDYSSESFYRNLFISSGHASQGLSTTPIAAELIASLLFNEPLPLDKELVDLLNPARILARSLNRQ